MDKKTQIKAILAAIACHVAWGFSFLASRKGLDAAPVFVLLSHRFGLSFFVLNLLALLGVIAGLAPAFRAMQIKPVDAMREE